MNFEEEISLLIKSRYPLVLVDTIDEDYVLAQLQKVARDQSFVFYSWSLTKGLRVGNNENSFYKTTDAAAMLLIVNDLLGEKQNAVFTFLDFDRFLGDAVTCRSFKDIINHIQGTPSTVVLIGAEAKLPPDIAPLASRISGGYPDERQILDEVSRIVSEFKRTMVNLKIDMPPEVLSRVVKTLKGLSLQQIRNAINMCVLKNCRFDADDLPDIEKFKKEAFDHDGILEYFAPEAESGIAGFDNLKRWITDRRNAFFTDGPLPPPKGLLSWFQA